MHRATKSVVGLAVKVFMTVFLLIGFLSEAAAQVHVRGYFRKNGTYVAPYVRSSPNSTRRDNYSTRGNYNPYNGRAGTDDPYAAGLSGSLQSLNSGYPQPSSNAGYPAVQGSSMTSVYRCDDAQGGAHYISYPRSGCVEIQIDQPVQQTLRPVAERVTSGGWSYRNCSEARAAGAAPVRRGEPGYGPHLDRDHDGIGCEPYRGR